MEFWVSMSNSKSNYTKQKKITKKINSIRSKNVSKTPMMKVASNDRKRVWRTYINTDQNQMRMVEKKRKLQNSRDKSATLCGGVHWMNVCFTSRSFRFSFLFPTIHFCSFWNEEKKIYPIFCSFRKDHSCMIIIIIVTIPAKWNRNRVHPIQQRTTNKHSIFLGLCV